MRIDPMLGGEAIHAETVFFGRILVVQEGSHRPDKLSRMHQVLNIVAVGYKHIAGMMWVGKGRESHTTDIAEVWVSIVAGIRGSCFREALAEDFIVRVCMKRSFGMQVDY